MIRAAFIILATLTLLGCDQTETLRYRLTVEVETPVGPKVGSSVIEVEVREQSSEIYLGNRVRLRPRGEAAAVDLPNGRVLFALLRDETSSDAAKVYPWRAFDPPQGGGHEWGIHAARALKQTKGSQPIPPRYYPMLVTFGDLSDPASIEQVDPDDLAAAFGEGFCLKRITVQMTDDPVTNEIDKRLRWLIDTTIPGWQELPVDTRRDLIGLRIGKVGSDK